MGRPGFIRIDRVHQGDFGGIMGLYPINAVDCVTQWQVVASVPTIAENHLLWVIEQMLQQFPFEILGFHADHSSECVNHRVAGMTKKRIHAQPPAPQQRQRPGGDQERRGGAQDPRTR